MIAVTLNMSDAEMILSAVADVAPRKQSRRVLQEFTSDGIFEAEMINKKDAIAKLADKARRKDKREQRKRRPVAEWNSTDFLVYTQDILKPYRITLESPGSRTADMMSKLYDKLATVYRAEMTNQKLKDYLQWWVLLFAPGLRSPVVYMQTIYDEKYVAIFCRKSEEVSVKGKTHNLAIEQNSETIYKTGGLPMLLMSKGIVLSYVYLKSIQEQNLFTQITKVLRTLSLSVFQNTMDITLNNAPYSSSDKVDFVSIARPVIDMHGLKQYANLDYNKFFEGRN